MQHEYLMAFTTFGDSPDAVGSSTPECVNGRERENSFD